MYQSNGWDNVNYDNWHMVNNNNTNMPTDMPAYDVKPHTPNNDKEGRVCINCATTSTPMWRRSENGEFMCNACGLHHKNNGTHRQLGAPKKRKCVPKRTGIVCKNCETTNTSLWRRNQEGDSICNACGLYYKTHGEVRPIKMKKDAIVPRQRGNGSGKRNRKGKKEEEEDVLKDTNITTINTQTTTLYSGQQPQYMHTYQTTVYYPPQTLTPCVPNPVYPQNVPFDENYYTGAVGYPAYTGYPGYHL